MSLNLFPARIEIGQFRGADGKDIKVYQSPEFARALSDLLAHVGGALGLNTEELSLLINEAQISGGGARQVAEMADQTPAAPSPETLEQGKAISGLEQNAIPDYGAALAQLAQQVADLQQQIAGLSVSATSGDSYGAQESAISNSMSPATAGDSYSAQELAIAYSMSPPVLDWERPGKIGAQTPNTGKFTTLAASGQITSTLAAGTAPLVVASNTKVVNLNVDLLDGTDWTAPGTIGGVTPGSASFTTVTASGIIKSGVTGAAGMLQICRASDGAITGTDTMNVNTREIDNRAGEIVLFYASSERLRVNAAGATVQGTLTPTGGFGCNSKAAQTAYALGAAATDLATVLVLANNMRTMSINNGTGA